jgi:hypothetical protein
MSNEDEVLPTGPFDEVADEHERDYSDHHHHHQNEQNDHEGNGWNQDPEKHEQEQVKQDAEPSKLFVSNLSFHVNNIFPPKLIAL